MMNPEGKITILIVDNHPTTITGVRTLFSKTDDIKVVGELHNGYDVYSSHLVLKAKIILLDIAVSGPNPIELIQWILENRPNACVLIFTFIDDPETLASMMKAGACGYLSKEETESNIVEAIRKVANGEVIFNQEQHQKVKAWQEKVGDILAELTHQEIEVLRLLAKGHGNQEISQSLGVSVKTAAYHVSNLLSKLQVKSRQEAAIWAVKHLSDDLE